MKRLLISMGVALLLAACASKEPPTAVKVEDRSPPVTSTTTTTPTPTTQGTQGQQAGLGTRIDPLKDPNNPLSKRVIYFDYDKDIVKPEFASLVQAHASYLGQNRNRKVRLEGHADERGSREYNIALGQKRAEAVAKSLSLLGAGQAQVEAVSYGKERPAVQGNDEAAWAKNRRAELNVK